MTRPARSIVLLTIDSLALRTTLRVGSVIAADLQGVEYAQAESFASFTFPAHTALLWGHLPYIEPLERLNGGRRPWRPAAVSHAPAEEYISGTLPGHFSQQGYRVLGFGGVGHFDPQVPDNLLPGLFDEFWYRGVPGTERLPLRRPQESFTSSLFEEVAAWVDSSRSPFFLFGNINETHFPYDFPGSVPTEMDLELMDVFYKATKDKRRRELSRVESAAADRAFDLQGRAFAHLVSRLPTLFDAFRRHRGPVFVLVMADHGEEFGESGRLGHGHASPEVLSIPLWVGVV